MALSENGTFPRDAPLPNPSLVRDSQILFSETPPLQSYGAQNTTAGERKAESSILVEGLDPKDIVILVKTGATSIWRRMPAHMSTTLSNPALTPNIIYYSDSPDNINGNPVIDVLANVSESLKSSPDFTLYNRVKEIDDDNLYLESGSMEGDFSLPGGWRLDKYKFVPMFQHVAEYMPDKNWYIYMEVSYSIFSSQTIGTRRSIFSQRLFRLRYSANRNIRTTTTTSGPSFTPGSPHLTTPSL
jgi:hypothetical protein